MRRRARVGDRRGIGRRRVLPDLEAIGAIAAAESRQAGNTIDATRLRGRVEEIAFLC